MSNIKEKMSTLNRHPVIKGTIILTAASIISRLLGFLYRAYVSNKLGLLGMGLYQLVFPVITLSFALCISGIKTVISKCVSSYNASKNSAAANSLLIAGTLLSVSFSVITATILYANAHLISTKILGDSQCTSLIRIVTLSLPAAALHSSIDAYYLGCSNAKVSALTQLIEQFTRISFIFLVCINYGKIGKTLSPDILAAGMVAGETVSAIISIIILKNDKVFSLRKQSRLDLSAKFSQILKLSTPITTSRTALHIFQSIEIILIPNMLVVYGFSHKEALQTLGLFTGMALPLILFPASIIGSYSVMLLPKVSGSQASLNISELKKEILSTVRFCISFGIFCMFGFLFYGCYIGAWLFGTSLIIPYIKTLSFLCPFLYISMTFGSILNGLSKTGTYMVNTIISLSIRICFVLFSLPYFGIKGYLTGILISESVLAALHFYKIYKLTHIPIPVGSYLIKSIGANFIYFAISYGISLLAKNTTCNTLVGVIAGGAVYLLLYILSECKQL